MTGCLIKEVTIKDAWQRYYKSSRAMIHGLWRQWRHTLVHFWNNTRIDHPILQGCLKYVSTLDVMKIWSLEDSSIWKLCRRIWRTWSFQRQKAFKLKASYVQTLQDLNFEYFKKIWTSRPGFQNDLVALESHCFTSKSATEFQKSF